MTLEEYLNHTKERIPTVEEMASLCDTLGIGFALRDDGKPVLKTQSGVNSAEGQLLASLFRREPFRSQVIAMKLRPDAPAVMPIAPDKPEEPAEDGPDPYDERVKELLPRIGFPPDEFMGRAYQDWLKTQ